MTSDLRALCLVVAALLGGGCRAKGNVGELPPDGSTGNPDGPAGPPREGCGNGFDDDGDGLIDENCTCPPGSRQGCWKGSATTRGRGTCSDGMVVCLPTGQWGECTGGVGPATEKCGDDGNGDKLDQDCDGAPDNGCRCSATADSMPRECPVPPVVGECKKGTQRCGPDGKWTECVGQVPPRPEICGNGKDEDCNGKPDDGCLPPPPPDGPPAMPPDTKDASAELPPPAEPTPAEPPLAEPPPDAPVAEPPVCTDLPAPRLVSPLSTALVTSKKPILEWALAAGTDGARIELCKQRACTDIIATIDATGTTAIPAADLPQGVVFWRATALAGTSVGCKPGLIWEFFVGHGSAPTNSTWGTVLDVNGDGHADMAVAGAAPDPTDSASTFSGRVHVYLGGPAGLGTTPTASLDNPAPASEKMFYGASVASAGDVDGDGFADLVVGAPLYAACSGGPGGRAYVYRGGSTGLATTPVVTIPMPGTDCRWLGTSVASAGDIDRDGYADLAIGAPSASVSTQGQVFVFQGGPSGPSVTPWSTLAPPTGLPDSFKGYAFGYLVSPAGDVNGDRYADVVVSGFEDAMVVHMGGPAGIDSVPAMTRVDPAYITNDYGGLAAADVNGDGYCDVLSSDVDGTGAAPPYKGMGGMGVHMGGPAGIADLPAAQWADPSGGLDGVAEFGSGISSAGDVDGDGYVDIVVGADLAKSTAPYLPGPGMAFLYRGGPGGLAAAPSSSWDGPGTSGDVARYGAAVAGGGDFDRDGFADIVVGAPWGYNYLDPMKGVTEPGAIYVYRGSAAGPEAAASTTLAGPDGAKGRFGHHVSFAGGGGP